MLISLLIFLLLSNALILRKDKSIFFSKVKVFITGYVVIILFKLPLSIGFQLLGLYWMLPILSGITACLIFIIKHCVQANKNYVSSYTLSLIFLS